MDGVAGLPGTGFWKTRFTGPLVTLIVAQDSTGCRRIQRSHMLRPVRPALPRLGEAAARLQ